MKGTWRIFRLLLVAKTYHKSVPSTGRRWRWQQVPTKPSQVQSHCIAGRLLSKPSKPLFSLPFPVMPLGCLGKWASQVLAWNILKDLPGPSRAGSQFLAYTCFSPRPLNLACRSPEWVESEG